MSEMIDIWFKGADESLMRSFCADYENVLGPAAGSAAVEADPESDPPIEAQAARGAPGLWYACVRTRDAVILPDACAPATADEGIAVLGLWA